MKRATSILALLAASLLARNETTEVRGAEEDKAPDLAVVSIDLPPGAPATVEVQVENRGEARSGAAVLRLTLAGKSVDAGIPALEAGRKTSVSLNAAGFLPAGASLKEMDFRVEADPGDLVSESKEDNNRKAHKGIALPPPAGKPDLEIKGKPGFASPQTLKVQVFNRGDADAQASVLRLEIVELDGKRQGWPLINVPIGRLGSSEPFPADVDASSIIGDKSLRNADFILTVDAGKQVEESNENNNQHHHRPE